MEFKELCDLLGGKKVKISVLYNEGISEKNLISDPARVKDDMIYLNYVRVIKEVDFANVPLMIALSKDKMQAIDDVDGSILCLTTEGAYKLDIL